MSFLLHVEFDASSDLIAIKMLENLARMADIVHRDYPDVYTYVFRYANEAKTRLIFTELYGNEQVFLEHSRDTEFRKLYQEAFNNTAGKTRKELCIRKDINNPLLPITATILDNYLHVTYISVQQGFLYRHITDKIDGCLLIVCRGCDEQVYERLNMLVKCVTCVTFEESDKNRQLIAVTVQIPNEQISIKNDKPLIDTMELVCPQEEIIQKFKDMINDHFQIQSLQVQTNFSGYIYHKSS
ncbi:unnamed protein product [Rotaria sp. Silwood2]|nr:unnamed protein product [Rotaria sp. Silwood2]